MDFGLQILVFKMYSTYGWIEITLRCIDIILIRVQTWGTNTCTICEKVIAYTNVNSKV